MFVQIVRGTVADEVAMSTALDRWEAELRPGAVGFLGSTAGLAKDGLFVLVARFTDEAAARHNSDRPEQGRWWSEAERAFSGPADFFESGDVDVSTGGGADDAGFVQVLIGEGDRERAREILKQGEDGSFVDVAYFRSEAEARAGESQELSVEGRALFEQLAVVMPVRDYVDLPEPRFV